MPQREEKHAAHESHADTPDPIRLRGLSQHTAARAAQLRSDPLHLGELLRHDLLGDRADEALPSLLVKAADGAAEGAGGICTP